MLFKNIAILDQDFNVSENRYVGIKADKIHYIGTEMPSSDYGEVYDGTGKLLMSGFFNTHAHTPMTLMRGYGENLSLQSWLNDRIFPFEDHLDGDAVYYGTLLGIAESLRYGIVSTTDMYYFCEEMAQAFLESGAKCNLSRGTTCFTDEELKNMQSFRESRELLENYDGVGGGRLKVEMSLHAEYTSPSRIAEALADYARERGTGMHVHVSETLSEHEGCKERHGGRTPVQYLNDCGIFDTRTTAAHCVWLEEGDMDILAEKGVSVASCPASNLKLASGVCNVPALMKKGVNVALGTDSVASNNSLNFIEEMKLFSLIQKAKWQDPTLITPKELLKMATTGGALSQGRTDTGVMKEGYKADLIVLDLTVPNMHPVHDVLNNLVYAGCGSQVLLTMVNGKVLYREGIYLTVDLEKVIAQAEKAKNHILAELGTAR